jgi:hypothetical protein
MNSNWGIMNWTVDNWYIDVDADQMDDNWETAQFGNTLRDGTQDFDGDGIIDSIEYSLGLSANSADSDHDGLVDGAGGVVDVNDYPGGIDIDGDGFVDGEQDLGTDPAVSNLGDLAPRNSLDNMIGLGDLLVLTRLVSGAALPSDLERILGDINGDTLLNAPDILLLQQTIMNGTAP